MKKAIKRLVVVVIYLLLLSCLLGADVMQIFSLKLIGIFLIGSIILCLPYIERKSDLKSRKEIFSKNAMIAGYLQTFILFFVSLQQNEMVQEDFLSELALDLRPIFYGFVCYIVCREEEQQPEKEKQSASHTESVFFELSESDAAVRGQKNEKVENKTENAQDMDLSVLTRREFQIAELMKKGLTNREIGEELFISETTVKKHVSNIFEKLGIESRKDLKQ